MPDPLVVVVIATYQRPGDLARALSSLAAASAGVDARVGVVVVDDDAGRSAEKVADDFSEGFSAGCRYLVSGARNISVARNLGLEAAIAHSDWTASIDDDVVVPPGWFTLALHLLADGAYTAVTGPLWKDYSDGPVWLSREPFGRIGITAGHDGQPIDVCATGNNWVQSQFYRDRPSLRFDPQLGRTGGEDVDFFYRSVEAGLRPVFHAGLGVTETQVAGRLSFRYQLRRAFWLGVTEGRTYRSVRRTSRLRLGVRAGRRALTARSRDLSSEERSRIGWRFRLTIVFESVGLVAGSLGIRMGHK